MLNMARTRKGAEAYLSAFFVVCGFVGATPTGANPGAFNCAPPGPTESVTISTVVDGDTVHLQDGRKVRLIGINTPELGHNGEPSQPWSSQAQSALLQFLDSQPAQLLFDKDKFDNHGRVLAHLYNHQGGSAEAHLLKLGLGWHVAVPPNLTLANCLAKAEMWARDRHLGVWSANGIAATQARLVNRGGFQRVRGTVSNVNFGKTAWWIVLDNWVAAVIYPENQHRFDRATLQDLMGKPIEIQGWVYASHSKRYQPWRMKLETGYALENLGAAPTR